MDLNLMKISYKRPFGEFCCARLYRSDSSKNNVGLVLSKKFFLLKECTCNFALTHKTLSIMRICLSAVMKQTLASSDIVNAPKFGRRQIQYWYEVYFLISN